MNSALIIDDVDENRESLSLHLTEQDIAVWCASSTEEAFQILEYDSFDIIYCALKIPFTLGEHFCEYIYSEEVGVRTIEELQWVYPDLPIVALSEEPERDLIQFGKRLQGVRIVPRGKGPLAEALPTQSLPEQLFTMLLEGEELPKQRFDC